MNFIAFVFPSSGRPKTLIARDRGKDVKKFHNFVHILWRHSFVFVADTEVIMEVLITRLSLVLWNLHNSNLICPNPGRREKIKLNLYFHTFLWCLKRFYEGLKGCVYSSKNWKISYLFVCFMLPNHQDDCCKICKIF